MRSSAVVLVCLYLKSFVLAQRFGGKSIMEHFSPLLLIIQPSMLYELLVLTFNIITGLNE